MIMHSSWQLKEGRIEEFPPGRQRILKPFSTVCTTVLNIKHLLISTDFVVLDERISSHLRNSQPPEEQV